MTNSEENKRRTVNLGRRSVNLEPLLQKQQYESALKATDEALRRLNRDQSNPHLASTDEIVERSPIVLSMRDELEASRVRIVRLNEALSEERRTRLVESEKLESAFAERERELTAAFSRRESELEKRMRAQDERSIRRERETLAKRAEFEAMVEAREKELDAAKAALDDRVSMFELEIARYQAESQKKLQTNSKSFVSGMVADLSKREKVLSRISLAWSVLGGAILVLATLLLGWATYISVKDASIAMSWSLLTFFALKGAVLVGIAGFASRYAFLMAANYMTEGLRTADRVHAIKFGQFYVETYGVAASWEQVKETFSNWNGVGSGTWGHVQPIDASTTTVGDLTNAISTIANLAKKE